MIRAPVALLALMLALPAAAQEAAAPVAPEVSAVPEAPKDPITQAHYICERGAQIEATYVNTLDPPLAVLVLEGQQVVLRLAPAASGARYEQAAEGTDGYVWWTQGILAMLIWRSGEGKETTLLNDCAAF